MPKSELKSSRFKSQVLFQMLRVLHSLMIMWELLVNIGATGRYATNSLLLAAEFYMKFVLLLSKEIQIYDIANAKH